MYTVVMHKIKTHAADTQAMIKLSWVEQIIIMTCFNDVSIF